MIPNSDELDGFLDDLFVRFKIDEIVPPRRKREMDVIRNPEYGKLLTEYLRIKEQVTV